MLKVAILGNIANAPTTKSNKNGNEFVVSPLAVTAQKDRTFYADTLVNGAVKQVMTDHGSVGRSVYVEGLPAMRPRKDNSGNVHANLSVRGDTVRLQDRKGGSRGIAQATLIGRLTDDVSTDETSSGNTRSRCRVAVNFKVGDNEVTEYISVTAFSGLASVLGYAEKGQKILVTGNFEPRAFETKQGDVRAEISVTAASIVLMAKSGDNADSQDDDDQDKIPF